MKKILKNLTFALDKKKFHKKTFYQYWLQCKYSFDRIIYEINPMKI